ncbi:type VI secretion system Vgr family protein [Vibrio atypicus]|uniref:type VI secretion system Vgr family protein n=1 Tax=Vibrio atypicus TaxID=558271 RepID=UPI003736C6CA
MEKSSQDNNIIQLETSLGKDVLHLTKFSIKESMSAPFLIVVSCYTNGVKISPKDVIGKSVNIKLAYQNGYIFDVRYFHGVVTQIYGLGSRVPSEAEGEKYKDYQLCIEPAITFLKQRKNCRVFQNLTVVQILETILGEYADVKFSFEHQQSYTPFEYKTQYNESDYDFVHRLLEESGIYYFFEYDKSCHRLIFSDDVSAYRDAIETPVVFTTGSYAKAHVHSWTDSLSIPCGKRNDIGYDFLSPSTYHITNAENTNLSKQQQQTEVFTYHAESSRNAELQKYTDISLDASQLGQEKFSGGSLCSTFSVGQCFMFSKHEDPSFKNRNFLITELDLTVEITSQTGAVKQGEQILHNTFTCIPKEVLFRPAQITARPLIYGAQTAIVTGNSDEEIHVDEHGRIKVLFHWDRLGKADTSSSCWVRVAQSWAGNGFGSFFLPRVGQEVVVSFLEGDPDQPIITGSLYNGGQRPPYELPTKRHHSGIKTRSTKGGGASNFNELRFVDDKGNELLYLQAEKDLQTEVKQCQRDKVGKNLVIDVGNNTNLVSGDSITIKTGGASITMSSGGDIEIKGTSIKINGSSIALSGGSISLN